MSVVETLLPRAGSRESLLPPLLVLLTVVTVAGNDVGSAGRYALIVPLALAMGIQNATARRLAVPDLTTTVLTMTLTGIAADSRLAGGSQANTARRVIAVAAMLLGALVGAVLLRELAPVAPVVLAAALLAAVCGAASRGTSRVARA